MKDWLRREIETAIEAQRNIIPLMLEDFTFDNPLVASQLIGKLQTLSKYNALPVYPEYFNAAMGRLREKFLNVELNALPHPASEPALRAAEAQQAAANAAPPFGQDELKAAVNLERALGAESPNSGTVFLRNHVRGPPATAGIGLFTTWGSWKLVIIAAIGITVAASAIMSFMWSFFSSTQPNPWVPPSTPAGAIGCSEEKNLRSLPTAANTQTNIFFENNSGETKRIYWLDTSGKRVLYANLAKGNSINIQTFATHPWVVANNSDKCEAIYIPQPSGEKVTITK